MSGGLGVRNPFGNLALVTPQGGAGGSTAPTTTGLKVDPWRRADQLSLPGQGWPVTIVAPTDKDNTDPEFWVARFDDSVEWGRGFSSSAPTLAVEGAVATQCHIDILFKPRVAPGGVGRSVRWKFYYNYLRNGVAPLAVWDTVNTTEVGVANGSLLPILHTFDITIGAGADELDVSAGDLVYFEITRVFGVEGINLTDDAHLLGVRVRWSAP